MGYAKLLAASTNDLYDQLITLLTADLAVGDRWTDEYTFSTRDRLVSSTGVSGNEKLLFRLTVQDFDGSGYKSHPTYNSREGAYPHIIVSGAQGHTTSTMRNVFDEFGPWILHGPVDSGSDKTMEVCRPEKVSQHTTIELNDVLQGNAGATKHIYDGGRYVYYYQSSDHYFYLWDIVSGEKISLAARPVASLASAMVLVIDPVTNIEHLYVIFQTSTQSQVCWSLNLSTKTWTNRAGVGSTGPGWGATSPNDFSKGCWDGKDRVYFICANNTTKWSVYNIATDTWTFFVTAALPANANNLTYGSNMLYIRKGLLDGISATKDFIVYYDSSSNTVRFFQTTNDVVAGTYGTVDSGTWTSYNFISGADTNNSYHTMIWDQRQYLYAWLPNNGTFNGTLYRMNLKTNSYGTWAPVNEIVASGRTTIRSFWVDPAACKIKGHSTNTITAWVDATKDRVVIVTLVEGKYSFAYFGRYDTNFSPHFQIVEDGPVTPAIPSTIHVASNAEFEVGERNLIVDPSTSYVEKTTVVSKSSDVNGPYVKGTLLNQYENGSLIGQDPMPYVLADDGGFAVTLLDSSGYETDKQAAGYSLLPEVAKAKLKTSMPTDRGFYMPWRWEIINRQSKLGFNNIDNARGTLQGALVVDMTSIVPEQNIVVTENEVASVYKCFPIDYQQELYGGGKKLGIAIGPLVDIP